MKNLRNIVDKFSNKKVLVIGDLMVDEYIFGNVERISPEAPVPILDVKDESSTLGGAGNVVKNLVALGADVTVCSVIGFDNTGDLMLKMLRGLNVNTHGLYLDQDRKTSTKTRIIAGSQQIVRVDKESKEAINNDSKKYILDFIERTIEDYEAVIISDYAKGVISKDVIDVCVKEANIKNIPVNVDPKEKNYYLYKGVTTVTPNLKELSIGTGVKIQNEGSIDKASQITINKLGCKTVLATRGPEGMSLFTHSGVSHHIPTFAKKVFDVTGAGDTVISVYTLALISGADEIESSYIANAAAGYVVGQIGAVVITPDKLKEEVDDIIF